MINKPLSSILGRKHNEFAAINLDCVLFYASLCLSWGLGEDPMLCRQKVPCSISLSPAKDGLHWRKTLAQYHGQQLLEVSCHPGCWWSCKREQGPRQSPGARQSKPSSRSTQIDLLQSVFSYLGPDPIRGNMWAIRRVYTHFLSLKGAKIVYMKLGFRLECIGKGIDSPRPMGGSPSKHVVGDISAISLHLLKCIYTLINPCQKKKSEVLHQYARCATCY